jgi:hypothetical protein
MPSLRIRICCIARPSRASAENYGFRGYAENSLKDKIDHTEAENLHYMVDGAERMKKMIDGLLVFRE